MKVFVGVWRDANGIYKVKRSKDGYLYAERKVGAHRQWFHTGTATVGEWKYEKGLIGTLKVENLEWADPIRKEWVEGTKAADIHTGYVVAERLRCNLPNNVDPLTVPVR